MPAILFGSISTVADTSELQRQAFNQAFAAHGLQWRWDQEDYRASLAKSGGQSRIAAYAKDRGENVDATAIHQTKSKIFQQSLAASSLTPRPGVLETIRGAKEAGLKIGLVTTTSADNVTALIRALGPDIEVGDFDVIVDSSSVSEPKPNDAAYTFALQSLGEEAEHCVAVEDNVDGVAAAQAAGVACVPFPNENTAEHDFGTTQPAVDRLDLTDLRQLTRSE